MELFSPKIKRFQEGIFRDRKIKNFGKGAFQPQAQKTFIFSLK